jgi:predicted ATPase/DNA-binding NarL/FixJ family response regulator
LDTGSPVAAEGILPVALTSLVGRQRELRQLGTLLRSARLLTLVGTGGCGKTRLGLALAEAHQADFAHGAWWIDLSSVTDRPLVAGTVASALGIPETPGQDMAVTMARQLRARTALLVFDNCEQVVDVCAELIERLLGSCPGLTAVATSREVLGVAGETVFRVDGLRVPAQDEDAAEAVELFTERARALTPGFAVGPADRATVAWLCRRLDGLPLALELAAARAGVLGVAEIARRLGEDGDAGGVLRHPSRTAPARQRTMEATLDWSYLLLTEEERVLFRRLSCFSGSFTLAAAETVAADERVPAAVVVGLLTALIDKSLVLAAGQGVSAEHRFRLLGTIRRYGERKLAESGEEPALRAAHAAFYLRLAEQAHAGLEGVGQEGWLERLELEHDNLRLTLRRLLDSEPATGARLAALLWSFWYRRGHYREARGWLEQAARAALGGGVPAPVTAAVLTGAGVLAFLQCDYPVAAEQLGKARALYEEEGDRRGLATTLQRLGSIAREEGRYADARRLHEESLAIWTELGDAVGVAASQDYLGFTAWLAGDAARGRVLSGKAADAFRAAGLRQETAAAGINEGIATYLGGDTARGAALVQSSLEIATQVGYQEGIAWALHGLAVMVAGDDQAVAADMLGESLEIHGRLGDRWRIASVVETIAELVVAQADASLAATLVGAAAQLRQVLGAPVPPAERAGYDRCVRALRETLGPHRFRTAMRQGERMRLDELVDLARQAVRTAADGPPPSRQADRLARYGLTERETAVFQLLGRGLTNREIAGELLISTGTVGVHVSNILRKLNVSSRVQAAAIVGRIGDGN